MTKETVELLRLKDADATSWDGAEIIITDASGWDGKRPPGSRHIMVLNHGELTSIVLEPEQIEKAVAALQPPT